jgi:hypothetical protein
VTVGELIAVLGRLDPSIRAVVRGYEDGVNDVVRVDEIEIELNANSSVLFGAHNEIETAYFRERALGQVVAAVHIIGGRDEKDKR